VDSCARQKPEPGRFSLRFACLSARFSFNDLVGFLALSFFGDLSPMSRVHSLSSVVVAAFLVRRCAQGPDRALMMFQHLRRGASIVRPCVGSDHAPTLSGTAPFAERLTT